MKKTIKILYLLCCIVGILSCDDFLNAVPEDKISNDNFWTSENDAKKMLVDLYSTTFPKSGIFWDEAMSDNAFLVWSWWGGQKQVANGNYTAYGQVPKKIWSSCYSNIRKCWFLLEGIEKLTFKSEGDLNEIKGQAYFILAYNYYLLTTYFGDVPLVETTLTVPESKEFVNSPKSEVVAYTINKLEEASLMLEGLSKVKGRISSGACDFLVSRIYLYNGDYENVLTSIGNLEGKYQLNMAGEHPYDDLFSGASENNLEIILSVPCDQKSGSITTGHRANAGLLLKGMSGGDPYRGITPTGSLVDSYPMADGRLIHEQGSSYDPNNPYESRDPRLYESIIYPSGQSRYLDVATNTIQTRLYDPEDPSTIVSQQYNAPEPSATGYIWNKYIDFSIYGMNNIWDCTNDIILFRYADVLLMKAEALVQKNGASSQSEVCNLIDQLRDRCKGGKVHRENYTSKDQLLVLVKNERRVELANEGTRFFDLIRWKDAEKNTVDTGVGLSGELYGAYMRLDGVGKNDRTVLVDGVPRRYIETRTFDSFKGYRFPIPQSEIDLNENLIQNPGW